jgi:hypothetical protein
MNSGQLILMTFTGDYSADGCGIGHLHSIQTTAI